jgi:hypothetical protein
MAARATTAFETVRSPIDPRSSKRRITSASGTSPARHFFQRMFPISAQKRSGTISSFSGYSSPRALGESASASVATGEVGAHFQRDHRGPGAHPVARGRIAAFVA